MDIRTVDGDMSLWEERGRGTLKDESISLNQQSMFKTLRTEKRYCLANASIKFPGYLFYYYSFYLA